MDYVQINLVKHGDVACVTDWPYSSIHRYIHAGILTAICVSSEVVIRRGLGEAL